jgi:hypothetical protein
MTNNIKLKKMSELGKTRFISPYIFDGRKNKQNIRLTADCVAFRLTKI